jgi:uncharacterized zinc-type alcohol dehydrogenase-like protein
MIVRPGFPMLAHRVFAILTMSAVAIIPLLKLDATYCRVGVAKVIDSNEIGQMNLVLYRNALAGSNTGSIQETQDMVDFCAINKIKPEITESR